jgi:hypothetical protein
MFHNKVCRAASAVTAHLSRRAVSIVVEHSEIIAWGIFDKYEPVSSYPETSVAQPFEDIVIIVVKELGIVSYNDKVIACTLIFVKGNYHSVKMKLIIKRSRQRSVKKTKICKTIYHLCGCKDT